MEHHVMEPRKSDAWLAERLRILLSLHYADVPPGYPIKVGWGRASRNRYGCIYAEDGVCHILISRCLSGAPAYVVDATMAHELAHYAHGFGSGLPRKHKHPHKGGVVEKELEARGLSALEERAARWRQKHLKHPNA